MSNPNFKQDPCYIKWKAEQDSKLHDIWSRRDELEKQIAKNEQTRRQNEAQERENRRNYYTFRETVKLVYL